MKALRSLASSAFDRIGVRAHADILSQAGWLAAAKIVQGVAGILSTLVVARHLGPTVFGELSLAIATASFVAAAATLGLEQIATREMAATGTRASATPRALYGLRIAGALLGSGLLLALAYVPQIERFGISGLLLVLCLLPLAQIGDLSEWRLIAAGSSRRIAIVAVALSPVMALARIWLAFEGAGIAAFAWTLIAEWAVRSLLLSLASRAPASGAAGTSVPPLAGATALLRESLPLLLSGIAVFVYMRIDQFMIASMLGSTQVGLYSAIIPLAEMPLVLPALLLRAALPSLTRLSAENEAQRDRTLTTLMRYTFYFHAFVAIALCALAEPIVVLCYGDAFRGAIAAFRVQVLAAPFVALGVLSSAWLVLRRCTGHALRRTLLGAVANIALNCVLIPRYGIVGAAAATLISQIIATYAADAIHRQTRALFALKTRALFPALRGAR
jgi:O-antigen/teichoic acid export membrane protein